LIKKITIMVQVDQIIQLNLVVSNNQFKNQKVSVVVYSNMEEEAEEKTQFKKFTKRWQA